MDSIHSPAVNKALTNGSLLMEHPDRSTKTIDSTLDNDTERGKDFNLQKVMMIVHIKAQ